VVCTQSGAGGEIYGVAVMLETGLSIAAFVISCFSVWFTWKLWVQSNRPVVTAMVRTHSGGNRAITFNIAVINSGTRPAVDVRLLAQKPDIENAMTLNTHEDPCRLGVYRCFSSEGIIAVLLNGQTVTNSFGYTSEENAGDTLWKVNAAIPIEVSYSDLEGRLFKSRVTLRIQDSAGFAGCSWEPESC
jgi:hypothetical protein